VAFTIRPVVLPFCLEGQKNGQLDPAILAPIPSERATSTGYQMVLPAARAYRAMHAAAKAKGLTLKPVSAADTYRPYSVQLAIYQQRYAVDGTCGGCKTCAGFGRRCKKRQSNGSCPATAACPGTSNHGWGLAVDLGVETDGDVAAESIGTASRPTPELTWLSNNADDFGFSWETLPEEYWHLRHYRGDDLAPAVLAYEASLKPQPEPPPEEEDLFLTRWQCTDADAAFFGWFDADGVGFQVEWCNQNADRIYGQHFDGPRGKRLDTHSSGLRNQTFVGDLAALNAAETRREWVDTDFRLVVPAAA
jgi:hypothetical protein